MGAGLTVPAGEISIAEAAWDVMALLHLVSPEIGAKGSTSGDPALDLWFQRLVSLILIEESHARREAAEEELKVAAGLLAAVPADVVEMMK